MAGSAEPRSRPGPGAPSPRIPAPATTRRSQGSARAPGRAFSRPCGGCGRSLSYPGARPGARLPTGSPGRNRRQELWHRGGCGPRRGLRRSLRPLTDTSLPGRAGAGETQRTARGFLCFSRSLTSREGRVCPWRSSSGPHPRMPAGPAARPRLTIEAPRSREKVGRRVDPGFWGRRALPGPRQQRRSRPEQRRGRGGKQSPRKAPAYLGSPGPGIDHAPVSAQMTARGAHVPCRARLASGTCGTDRAPTRSGRAAAAPDQWRPPLGGRARAGEWVREGRPGGVRDARCSAPTAAPGAL